jgi:hypothetical protein
MTARLVIDAVCPTCKGRNLDGPITCWICHGVGTVPQAVTCGECSFYRPWKSSAKGHCDKLGYVAYHTFVPPDWGCMDWEVNPDADNG